MIEWLYIPGYCSIAAIVAGFVAAAHNDKICGFYEGDGLPYIVIGMFWPLAILKVPAKIGELIGYVYRRRILDVKEKREQLRLGEAKVKELEQASLLQEAEQELKEMGM